MPPSAEEFCDAIFAPTTALAVERSVVIDPRDVVGLAVYTDGTGGGGAAPARRSAPAAPGVQVLPAWAVAVVASGRGGERQVLGAAGGMIRDFSCTRGQRGDSYLAEEAALLWAIAWILGALERGCWPAVRSVGIFSDSTAAQGIATGAMGPCGQSAIGGLLRGAYRLLACRAGETSVWAEYVPSHVGHPWNEMADVVASAAGAGIWPRCEEPILLHGCGDPRALAWSWLAFAPDEARCSYPGGWDGMWTAAEVRAPCREDLKAAVDVPAARPPRGKKLTLRFGTANVLTSLDADRPGRRQGREAGIRITGRAMARSRMFGEARLTFVGVQEARVRDEGTFSVGDYFVVNAPATGRPPRSAAMGQGAGAGRRPGHLRHRAPALGRSSQRAQAPAGPLHGGLPPLRHRRGPRPVRPRRCGSPAGG